MNLLCLHVPTSSQITYLDSCRSWLGRITEVGLDVAHYESYAIYCTCRSHTLISTFAEWDKVCLMAIKGQRWNRQSLLCLTLKGPGGRNPPPPSTFRAVISWIFFFRAASFHDFFLSSLAQLLALFSEKSGVRFQSYATLCNRASAQNLKIFWICVQNVWKMASCAKTPFWALKCSICFHYS